jgi:hypothetical protein
VLVWRGLKFLHKIKYVCPLVHAFIWDIYIFFLRIVRNTVKLFYYILVLRVEQSRVLIIYIVINWIVSKKNSNPSASKYVVYTGLLESAHNELQRTLVNSARRTNCVNVENLRSSSSPPHRGLGESPVPACNVVSQSIFFLVYLRLVFRMVDIYMLVVDCRDVPFFADVLSIYSCII